MPFCSFDANDYNLWYSTPHPVTGARLAYEREAHLHGNIFGSAEPQLLMNALGIQKGEKIVLIGAGYGFLGEMLAALGYGPICNVETSAYLHSQRELNQPNITLLNEDFRLSTGRKAIKQFLGVGPNAKVQWLITEDMITCFSDSEITAFLPHLREVATNVIHMTSVGGESLDPRLNWKSLEAWKTLLAPDKVVQRGTYQVL